MAIRTVLIDREKGTGELGLGGGITWDSKPRSEYEECLAKGRFALMRVPEFRLLESLLFDDAHGYFLMDRHLNRLSTSAAFFGFALDPAEVREALVNHSLPLKGLHKVRLLLSRNGFFTVESERIQETSANQTVAVAFAGSRVDSANVFLFHKTDNRSFYHAELAKRPDCEEVVFLNERGHVTEGANSNIVVRIGGQLCTPPLDSGLLPGTFRQELIETGIITERVITGPELEGAEAATERDAPVAQVAHQAVLGRPQVARVRAHDADEMLGVAAPLQHRVPRGVHHGRHDDEKGDAQGHAALENRR